MSSALSTGNCEFCLEQTRQSVSAFFARYREMLPDRTILCSEHCRVFPSLGQISEGHILITPLQHYTAIADMPFEMITELENIRKMLRTALEQIYGQCVFFEHGTRTNESGGCGIYHAHMHAVPIASNSVYETLVQKFAVQEIDSFSMVSTAITSDSSYLFFEDADARKFVMAANHLPSQFMRKVLANATGKGDWDWRKAGIEPELIRTHEVLSLHLRALSELSPQ